MALTDIADTTEVSPDTMSQNDVATEDTQSSKPTDYTNDMIHSPFMGTSAMDPAKVLQSPDASVEDKSSALDLLQKHQSNLEAQQNEAASQEVAKKAKAFNSWQTANEKYDDIIAKAKSVGASVSLPDRPDPSKFGLSMEDVAQLSNPKNQQVAAAASQQQDQMLSQNTLAQQQQDALKNGMQQKAIEQNTLQGYMAQQDKIAKHQQELMDESIKAVDDKQYQLDKIDPNKFWNSLSGGQRVMGTLAIALGQVGSAMTGGPNAALDMLNKTIDRDIESQKWSNDQKIAMKQNALKRVGLEIEKYSQLSKDNDRKLQFKMMADQLQQQQEGLKQQQAQTIAINKQLNSGGLPPDQFNLLVTDKEMQKKAVTLPNGNITVAPVEPTAEDRKMLLDKANGIKLLKEFQDTVNNTPMSQKMNPLSGYSERIKTYHKAIGGLMHVDLVGPGPYTEQKQEKVDQILGNAIVTTPELFNARMNGLQKLLGTSIKNSYGAIGVKLPKTPADSLRQKLYDMHKYTPEAIESAVQKAAEKDPKYQEQ
jgi:hypothetical protein